MNLAIEKQNQAGAALVISLVLLVIISVLAISSINSATVELAMARNDMNYENAFQAAESGLENALARGVFSTLADVNMTQNISAYEKVDSVIEFEDTTLVPDGAFSLGFGSGISAYHFNATATSRSKRAGTAGAATDRDASAVHSQAFYVVGPESPTI